MNNKTTRLYRSRLSKLKFDESYSYPFNSSKAHYDYQIMMLLAPIFESLNVDLVLNGHVHNYQRSLPLKFSPMMNAEATQYVVSPEG